MHAAGLQQSFPYLEVRSILEVEPIGSQLVSEFSGGALQDYTTLTPQQQEKIRAAAGRDKNWFRLWLIQMAEACYRDLGSVKTQLGAFEALLEGGMIA